MMMMMMMIDGNALCLGAQGMREVAHTSTRLQRHPAAARQRGKRGNGNVPQQQSSNAAPADAVAAAGGWSTERGTASSVRMSARADIVSSTSTASGQPHSARERGRSKRTQASKLTRRRSRDLEAMQDMHNALGGAPRRFL
jgi:hypothetical protein